ncbi:MAG TPA: cell division protein SepF [Aeromicrobium sp.]|nr:cell division protein SepF [Aeromicrobium sp.]
MAGAMRKMGEYLGLVEQADYDEYDDEPSVVVPVTRDVEPRPARTVNARGPVSHLDEHRRPRAMSPSALSRIETVTPRAYNDARTVGEHFREGVPVIMNLSEISDSEAKRLVDFAAGLVFSAHGSINRVTAKVFLLSPAGIEVTDEDKQRIAAGGFYDQH